MRKSASYDTARDMPAMHLRALNAAARVVAVAPTVSVNDALDTAYRWNADETREHMTVSSVEVAGRTYPVAVQGVLL